MLALNSRILAAVMLAACDSPGSSETSPSSSDRTTCASTKDCSEGETCYGRRCVAREVPQAAAAPPVKADAATTIGTAVNASASSGRAPSFDSSAYCESVSQAAGGSYAIKNACLEDEASAKRSIQTQVIPDRIYDYCKSVGEVIGGAYAIMAQCVKDETAAAPGAKSPDVVANLGSEKLPDFKTEAYCESVSQAIGGSFAIKRQCEEDEQTAKLELSRTKLPDRIYKYCQTTAKTIGGSYQIMLVCAQDELKAMNGSG